MTKQDFLNKSKKDRQKLIKKANAYYSSEKKINLTDEEIEFIEMCEKERNEIQK